ncbi:MAG TPA: ABC-2 family transporter protein [Chthonomonadales bacterium]|nr:ABC-2 family transporter protein [Chthonomonadales bacterium]
MRPYLVVLSARFRTLLQYRGAALGGFGTQLFWGIIRKMIFEGFYHSTTAPMPLSLTQTIDYIWLGQAFFVIIPWQTDSEVRQAIRTGTVAYELLRPLDLYGLWYARSVASRVAPAILRAAPMLLVSYLFFGLRLPSSSGSAAAFAAAVAGAILMSAAFTTLMTVSLMWSISDAGINRFIPTLVFLLSGMVVPLPLFPAWAQRAISFLPFRSVADVPFRLYSGQIPVQAIASLGVYELCWICLLVTVGRALVGLGTRRLVIQGG